MALNTILSIGSEADKADTLLLETGPDHCCCGMLDHPSKTFKSIQYFSFDELEGEQAMISILDQMPQQQFEKVLVCSTWEQALLFPNNLFRGNFSILDAVYDLAGQAYFSDAIGEWQMVAAYALPQSVHSALSGRFPNAEFIHAYTPPLKIYNGFVATDQIDLHFSTQRFRVLVKKDSAVMLAQTYSYRTPLDVVYYLLKLCYEFGLDQKEVFLVISGLVEKESALYDELHNYFLNLHFAQPHHYHLPEEKHPHYYFASLYNLAACVS